MKFPALLVRTGDTNSFDALIACAFVMSSGHRSSVSGSEAGDEDEHFQMDL